MTKGQLSSRKSDWLRFIHKSQVDVERLHVKMRAGGIITMGEVYKLAHKITALGDKSIFLSETAAALDMRDTVINEVREAAHLLEEDSRRLHDILIRRNLSDKHFPQFISMLDYDVDLGVDPMTDLDLIMGVQ